LHKDRGMRNRLTDAFIASVLGATATVALAAQQPARQGGAAAPAQPGVPTARTGRGGVEGGVPTARTGRGGVEGGAPTARTGRGGVEGGAPTARTGRGGVEGRGRAPAARPDRIAGHPNLNGVWQAINTANWNLESHSASPTAFSQLG